MFFSLIFLLASHYFNSWEWEWELIPGCSPALFLLIFLCRRNTLGNQTHRKGFYTTFDFFFFLDGLLFMTTEERGYLGGLLTLNFFLVFRATKTWCVVG